MTPQEFKAWFDGFTEAFSGVPNKTQWARVKERVAEIDGRTTTERIFVDRYYPTYPPKYWLQWTNYSTTIPFNAAQCSASGTAFNSTAAMYALGKADANKIAS